MTLNWLARAGLDGVAADMTVLFSTGPVDPLLLPEGSKRGFQVVRFSYCDVFFWKEKVRMLVKLCLTREWAYPNWAHRDLRSRSRIGHFSPVWARKVSLYKSLPEQLSLEMSFRIVPQSVTGDRRLQGGRLRPFRKKAIW